MRPQCGDTLRSAASVASPLKIYVGDLVRNDYLRRQDRDELHRSATEVSVGTHAIGTQVTANTTITWCTKDTSDGTPPHAARRRPYSLWRYRGSAAAREHGRQVRRLPDRHDGRPP